MRSYNVQWFRGPWYHCWKRTISYTRTGLFIAACADEAVGVDIEADGTPMGKGGTAASVWHQDAQSPLARARHLTQIHYWFLLSPDTRWLWGQHACRQEAIFGQVRNQPHWALSYQIMLRREPLCWCISIWFMRDFRIVRTAIDSC